MTNLRVKFTRWYYRKGYRMIYIPCDYADGVAGMIFDCPLWVRLLASFFFSASVYYREAGYDFGDSFDEAVSNKDCEVEDDNDSRLEDTEETV